MSDPRREIRVEHACEHNLKSLSLSIPRDRMVVFTGVSGSGKSSLAFDTIFAEGQRKYMESLSAYARQFLNQMQKPNVERIDGLPPTIAIQQRGGGHTPRSTVATTTEIYDAMRLLWARCGTPTCWHVDAKGAVCGRPIAALSATQITDSIIESFAGRRVMLAAPVVRAKKGFHKDVLEALQKQGLVRARVDGRLVDIRESLQAGGENPLSLGRYELHTVEAILDRVVPDAKDRQRLAESVEAALKLGAGGMLALVEDGAAWREHPYSEKLACPQHPECSLAELEPRLFSFNSPQGACAACSGLGQIQEFDPDLVVSNPDAGVADGAIEPWRRNGRRMNVYYARVLRSFCAFFKVDRELPFSKLPARVRRYLMEGIPEADAEKLGVKFEGVLPNLRRRYRETESEFAKERLAQYMHRTACPACQGRRLRPESLAVKIAGVAQRMSIADASALNVGRAIEFFGDLALAAEQRQIAKPILKEIQSRLGFLASVGLDYLTLDRASGTLSGGEAQRIRLATQVGSGLVGVCYVLDEPTIGLHQRDNDRLVKTLRTLTDIGNSVIVVEHDEDTIRAADHVVDIGPGPGRHGGTVVAQGTPDEVAAHPTSLTGLYLRGERRVEVPARRRPVSAAKAIVVRGARENNLKGIDAVFPVGGFICVTGVSGSGKSSLVNEVLLKAAQRGVAGARVVPGAHDEVTGLAAVERVIEVDQSPIGRTPRSNPATYTGIFDEIRKLFAAVPESRIRGYEPGRFSFNVKGGRCEACQGQGVRTIAMHFLPDLFVTCEACHGTRYAKETLDIRFKGRTIAEVLDMTVDDAVAFFAAHQRIHAMLLCLRDVGLGYMQLGQASTTLSGGEAQRIKLATELGNRTAGPTLYVLDEPTTGLHFDDVRKLLEVLNRLADGGHTLIVIEHNLDVIKCADWIVDLGPEGGDRGGRILAAGTPETVANDPGSATGFHLRRMLGLEGAAPPAKVRRSGRSSAAARSS
jgi:excinuclease ABC subunit A